MARTTTESSTGINAKSAKNWLKVNLHWTNLTSLFTDPRRFAITAALFVLLEIVANVIVINRVNYTEIDWKAYMQEVEGFLNGTTDYSKLKGDTGPLVYPAGFVYIFSLFYAITGQGSNIRLAQYIFAALYILFIVLVFRIYARTKKVPPYVLFFMCCTSYRIHSIFVLRLFNDPVAILLLYASLNAFLDDRWNLGSFLFSLAVSVKMNVLLFAPALFVAYVTNLTLLNTALQLFICGSLQLILALPFLLTDPIAYLKGSFDLARVFLFQWTVNWRFLPEDVFVNRYFHIGLLVLHLGTIVYFLPSWITYMKSYARLKAVEVKLKPHMTKKQKVDMSTMAQLFILPLFTCNFIGIMFSRSLHYQFYVWYYHTLPYIAWCTHYKTVTKIVLLGIVELCWNTYPSTVYSSAALHLVHLAVLYGLVINKLNTKVK